MTESEWLTWNDLTKFLAFLRKNYKVTRTKVGQRKLRLFACDLCRSIFWNVSVQDCYRQIVELAEQFADEKIAKTELAAAVAKCPSPHSMPNRQNILTLYHASWAMFETGSAGAKQAVVGTYSACRMDFDRTRSFQVLNEDKPAKPTRAQQQIFNQQQCGLLRDIFGNPFHPVEREPSWLTWKDGTVPKIAEAIYNDRDYSGLPILGDALEEAGCSNSAILNHCREPAEHARGCWVVDLVLGKGNLDAAKNKQTNRPTIRRRQ